MLLRLNVFFLLILGTGIHSWAWTAKDFGFEQRNKLTVQVEGRSVIQANGEFLYSYTIFNQQDSQQPIEVFAIEIPSDSVGFNFTAAPGWRVGPCCATDNMREKATGKKVTTWIFHDEMVTPGGTLGEFIIQGKGLPVMVDFYAQGYVQDPLSDGEIPEDTPEEKALIELWNFFNNSFSGVTIGAETIANTTNPSMLTLRLVNLNKQAAKLKWISDSVSFNQVEKHLKKAKDAITAKKEYVSRVWLEQLNSFLEEEKKKGSKDLTDNGYYLLKPNIDFILTKLPKEPKNGSERREAEKIRNNAK